MELEPEKKALYLSYFTVAYNIAEGIVSIIAGLLAGSIALIGFGMDSAVESLSGTVMIWRFGGHKDLSKEEEEKVEKKAVKMISITFFILGGYVLYESINKLYFKQTPAANDLSPKNKYIRMRYHLMVIY